MYWGDSRDRLELDEDEILHEQVYPVSRVQLQALYMIGRALSTSTVSPRNLSS
jgi:hypothetical protein